MIWKWEDDGKKWTPYSDDINKDICKAFKEGKLKANFTQNGTKFEIIFSRMVQRNSITCWERRIRLEPDGDDGGNHNPDYNLCKDCDIDWNA